MMRVAALAVVALSLAACSSDFGGRWDWNRMSKQQRYQTYGSNPLFADGSAMRVPPAGTVARESAWSKTQRPDSVDLARGERQYVVFCAVCHGVRGDGDGTVGRNLDRPVSLSLVGAASLADSTHFSIISNGTERMPAFAALISANDRWHIVEYIAQLRANAIGREVSAPPSR